MFLFTRTEPKVYWFHGVCRGRALSTNLRRGHISWGSPGRYLSRSFHHALSRRGLPEALGLADRDTGSPDSAQTQLQDFPSERHSSLSPCPSLSIPSLCVNP